MICNIASIGKWRRTMPVIKMPATYSCITDKTSSKKSAIDTNKSARQYRKIHTLSKRQQQALNNFLYGRENAFLTLL